MFFGAHHLIPSHETHHIASDNGDDNEHDNDENDENDQDDKDDRLLLVDHVTGIESTRTRTRPFAALIPASAAATNDKRYSDDQEAALKFPTNSTPTTPRFVPDQQLTDRTEYTSQKTFPRSHKYSSSFTVSYAHPGRPLVSSSTPPLQDHLNGRYTLTNGVESQVQDDDEVERAPFPVTSISQTDPHYGYTTSNATVLRRGGKASISATTTPLSQRSSMPSAAYSQYRQPQSDLAYSTFPSQGPATSSIMQSSLIGGTPMAPAPSSASNIGVGPGSGLSLTNGQGIGGYSGMPGQTANSANSSNGLVYPALHLHPLNDTFAPKQISLTPPGPQNRVKIGRQTNAKTIPHPNNGYFDSKVLSRMHAEVWSQEGKVYIKDVKSSNGTFINGERLSPEAQESDVFELHNEDMVEFGIDIVGDDNKTIIHHKVACRVYLVITAEDALGIRNDFASLYRGGGHGGMLSTAGVGPGAEGGLRRGKGGMSFDHILSRLQNELQKSRETGSELGTLTSTIGDIHDTLGGGLPPMQHPPYQHMVPHPPVRPGSHDSQKEAADDAAAKAHSATISALQTQLSETQASLASHLDKIRSLEGMLAEHELIKAEVGMIKSQMEEAKREMDEIVNARKPLASGLAQLNGKSVANGAQDEDDFDDGASMASVDTVIPDAGDTNMGQVPKGMDEVESAAIDAAENDAHVGPRAPPDLPPEVAARDAAAAAAAAEAGASEAAKSSNSISASSEELLQAQNSALSARLEALEVQLEEALSLSRNLQSQHALATDAVRVLEERVQSLEKEVETKVAQVEGSVVRQLEERWVEWRQQIEEGWRKEREGWAEEREELRAVVRAWDEANRELEEKTAWASSAGQNSSAGGADSAVGTASVGGAATNGKSSRRVKAAQRRQSKRHLNPALRQLLYKPAQNELDDSSEDEDEEEEGAEASGRRRSADLAKGGANSSSSSSTSGAATKDAQTSSSSGDQGNPLSAGSNEIAHDNKEMDDTRSGSHDLAGQARQGAPQHEGRFAFSDNPATLPLLSAAGVVVVGVAAWVLAGKGAGATGRLS